MRVERRDEVCRTLQVPRITLAGPSTREAEARGNGFSPEKLQSCLADIDCPDQVQNSQDLGFFCVASLVICLCWCVWYRSPRDLDSAP